MLVNFDPGKGRSIVPLRSKGAQARCYQYGERGLARLWIAYARHDGPMFLLPVANGRAMEGTR